MRVAAPLPGIHWTNTGSACPTTKGTGANSPEAMYLKGGSYAIRYTVVYLRAVSGSRWVFRRKTRIARGARSSRAERRTGPARSTGACRRQGRNGTRGSTGAGGTCWATRSSGFQFLCGSREWRDCVQSGRGSSGCDLRRCSGCYQIRRQFHRPMLERFSASQRQSAVHEVKRAGERKPRDIRRLMPPCFRTLPATSSVKLAVCRCPQRRLTERDRRTRVTPP